MKRKDCDKLYQGAAMCVRGLSVTPCHHQVTQGRRHTRIRACAVRHACLGRSFTLPSFASHSLVLLLLLLSSAPAAGAEVKMWSSSVVIEGQVHLNDISVLTGFGRQDEERLGRLVVAETPKPGGSRWIGLDTVRSVLAEAGTNMAKVTIRGATRCAVSRPTLTKPRASSAGSGRATHVDEGEAKPDRAAAWTLGNRSTGDRGRRSTTRRQGRGVGSKASRSLRQAVTGFFDREFARYGGRAEVVFDHTSGQVLDLTGPAYRFSVRRRGGASLGLVQLEVDVVADGRVVQTVPLVAQVAMVRPTLVARRTINQSATIGGLDVELVSMTYRRLDRLGLRDSAEAIGQRTKRMIAAGNVIQSEHLESVPLVMRGQIVKVVSVTSGIEVATSGKAVREGFLGETIHVRVGDRKKIEIAGTVVGPGKIRIGAGLPSAVPGKVVARTGG